MKRVAAVLLVFVLCLSVSCHGSGERETDALRAYFLDVGQGDCTLLRTAGGDVLIDCGSESSQESLCRKLKACGVERFALVLLTHPDEDHIGGADAVLEAFPTDLVCLNGADSASESAERLRGTLYARSVPTSVARAGDSFLFGEVLLTVLYPTQDAEAADGNGGSLVLRVQCGTISILMMGDAERETEKFLLAAYGPSHLSADLLHVGHHGSNSSSGEAFLQAVSPSYAVVSCGAGNRFGHPDGRTLARLSAVGATVLRTDRSGDILFASNGENLRPVS